MSGSSFQTSTVRCTVRKMRRRTSRKSKARPAKPSRPAAATGRDGTPSAHHPPPSTQNAWRYPHRTETFPLFLRYTPRQRSGSGRDHHGQCVPVAAVRLPHGQVLLDLSREKRARLVNHPRAYVGAGDALAMTIDHFDPRLAVLGTAFTHAGQEEVALTRSDLLAHSWLLGKSGRGKTSTIYSIVESLMQAGEGVGVIDPHGDLSQDLLKAIPSSRVRDLVYLDPASDQVVTFNPVETVPHERIAATAADVLASFKAVWGEVGWGARMERILYFALAALIEAPSTTLLCLPVLLKNEQYREKILGYVSNPIIHGFFAEEYAVWDDDYRATAIEPVLNKIEQLLSSEDVQVTLGTVTSSIEFSEIIDTRKVFVANLMKGRLGPSHAQLIGSLLVSGFLSAAFQRALTHPIENQRVPFLLAVDELGTFTTEAFAHGVSEARKFKLAVLMASQFSRQLPPNLRSALKANVANMIAFELSAEDAEEMAMEIGLNARNAHLLTQMRAGEVWLKTATYGGPHHVYMYPPTVPTGQWMASALNQNSERNTFARWRIAGKLDRFFEGHANP
jgi:hypothetical protein